MDNTIVLNKYFRASNLDESTVLLTTKLPFISEYNVPYCIDALDFQYYNTNKMLVLDISKLDYIDSTSIHLISKKITQITSHGGSIRLLVSEIKPRISYSVGDPVVELHKFFIQKLKSETIIN
jgi:anti-anti-sigma regulatory factor